jgi:hypothetical protein
VAQTNRRFWRIEIDEKTNVVFRRLLPGHLTPNEIAVILQRLACRNLSRNEVVGASIRAPKRTALLDARFDGPPKGKRQMVWLPTFPHYIARLGLTGNNLLRLHRV